MNLLRRSDPQSDHTDSWKQGNGLEVSVASISATGQTPSGAVIASGTEIVEAAQTGAAQPTHPEAEQPTAPRFSVIVPTFQTAAWVRECLDSINQQTFQGFELLVIDDGSTDGTEHLIDQYAQDHSRVRTFHVPHNLGPGPARNLGLEHATGEYIIFVDSDDVLPQHAFKSIDERLRETRDPELLIYNFARVDEHGQLKPYEWEKSILRTTRAVFNADQIPDVLYAPLSPCNKAYSRELITKNRIRFPAGHYEDLPWSCMMMLSARTIALHQAVCFHYRVNRQGSITNTPDDRQLEIFPAYERIFAFLADRPDPARWRAKILELSVLGLRHQIHRIPPPLRPEFDRRCADHFSGHPELLAQLRDAIPS